MDLLQPDTGGLGVHHVTTHRTEYNGAFVQVDPNDFCRVLAKQEEPLVIKARGGFFEAKNKYMTVYRGMYFITEVNEPLHLPDGTEVIQARRIWVPG